MDKENISFTEEQKEILNSCINRNLYVSAAPGSGKSTVLGKIAEKISNTIQDKKVILVTFTNKSAKSIILKCEKLDQSKIIGGTFHGLAMQFLRKNNINLNICDEGKKRLIIKKLFNCKKDKKKAEELIEEISLAKSEWPQKITDNVKKYNEELLKFNLSDFDDIIYNFINLIPTLNFENVSTILVDELQDTSGPQLEMLKVLQSKLKCKMIGVSDDDQCIYQWRGARPQNVEDFIDIFNCSILNMGYNFRSSVKIVECAKNIIELNKRRIKKTIRPFKTTPGLVHDYQCRNPLDEVKYVVTKCLTNQSNKITVLYRNRSFKNHLEFDLKKAGLKYCVNDSLEISDRSAIKVMISSMKLAAQIGDVYDLEIASKGLKGIGTSLINGIKKDITPTKNLGQVLVDKFHDEKNHRKLNSLISIVSFFNNNKGMSLVLLAGFIEKYLKPSFDYQEDMKNFINDITKDYNISIADIRDISNDLGLDGKQENQDEDANIELSTIHGYKGCERDIVIIPWCQMFEPQMSKDYDVEDERRLFYVGITRAENKLYLTYSGDKPKFIKEMKI